MAVNRMEEANMKHARKAALQPLFPPMTTGY